MCGVPSILCIILFIALLGVSSWALYEGIHSLKNTVTEFWSVVEEVRIKVRQQNRSSPSGVGHMSKVNLSWSVVFYPLDTAKL